MPMLVGAIVVNIAGAVDVVLMLVVDVVIFAAEVVLIMTISGWWLRVAIVSMPTMQVAVNNANQITILSCDNFNIFSYIFY